MKKLIFNEEKISDSEVNEIITKVKVFIINKNNEILLALSGGGVQLPGGHVENFETNEEALTREILEETGMYLKNNKFNSFFEIDHYSKNYKNTGNNRVSKIIYYTVISEQLPNKERMNLTKQEKENDFRLKYIPMDAFEKFIEEYNTEQNKDINKVIIKELMQAFIELKKYLNQN